MIWVINVALFTMEPMDKSMVSRELNHGIARTASPNSRETVLFLGLKENEVSNQPSCLYALPPIVFVKSVQVYPELTPTKDTYVTHIPKMKPPYVHLGHDTHSNV